MSPSEQLIVCGGVNLKVLARPVDVGHIKQRTRACRSFTKQCKRPSCNLPGRLGCLDQNTYFALQRPEDVRGRYTFTVCTLLQRNIFKRAGAQREQLFLI